MTSFGSTSIPGLRTVAPFRANDDRGTFVKLFHEGQFAEAGQNTRHPEIYLSTSRAGVLRGMHFQVQPHHHAKLVYCLGGSVLDVVVDLRVGSPSYRRWEAFTLDGSVYGGLSIPAGCAHGFLVQRGEATLLYMVETVHAPQADAGIRWNSFGFDWPVEAPICSERDALLPAMADFRSPFRFESGDSA